MLPGVERTHARVPPCSLCSDPCKADSGVRLARRRRCSRPPRLAPSTPLDARMLPLSNEPSRGSNGRLWPNPARLRRGTAAGMVAGVTPAPPRHVAWPVGPLGRCQWVPWAQLTGLTQSTADWATPVTDSGALWAPVDQSAGQLTADASLTQA